MIVAAMIAPCSVKANGGNLGSRCFWEPVTICDRFSASVSVRLRRARSAICFPGRREAIPGSNACVRRAASDGRSGLARSRTAERNAAGKLFGLSLPCFARKTSDLPSWQIPFDVYVLPCFARPGKQTSIRAWFRNASLANGSNVRGSTMTR
jgi:hypothetical protein